MTESLDYRPSSAGFSAPRPTPAWVVSLIDGAPAAVRALNAARDAEREAEIASSEASRIYTAAAGRVRNGLIGASFAEADAARVTHDAARATAADATRARKLAEAEVVRLVTNLDDDTRAAIHVEAAKRTLDAHERAAAALEALRAAVADLDDATPRTGVSHGAGSPEDALLIAAESLGLSPEQTEASFRARGMTPPVAGRVVARRPLHSLATRADVKAALRSVEQHLEATPVEVLGEMADHR